MRRFAALAATVLLSACASESGPAPTLEGATQAIPSEAASTEEQTKEQEKMSFKLTSSAFEHEDPVPVKYSCDGANVSPPLAWTDPPEGTQGFALIFDDPDAPAGTWVHWVLFNLPADARSLQEGIGPDPTLSDGAFHGSNSWNSIGYGGPCPPSGEHRYFFKLYALDSLLDLDAGATKEQLLEAMEGHILGQTELMGVYSSLSVQEDDSY